jgi:arsenite methyltransferase
VIMALGLREGEIVADIGAGSGYFTFRLTHYVGEKGQAYAVDVNPDMILYICTAVPTLRISPRISHWI